MSSQNASRSNQGDEEEQFSEEQPLGSNSSKGFPLSTDRVHPPMLKPSVHWVRPELDHWILRDKETVQLLDAQ